MSYRRPAPQRTIRKPSRTRKRQFVSSVIILLAVFALAWIAAKLQSNNVTNSSVSGVAFVIDGDTLSIDQQRIRLSGIDAPELDQSCTLEDSSTQCGQTARTKLRSKITQQNVTCEITGRDQYDRLLARCMLNDTDLNDWMVREGWAVSYGKYAEAETDARNAKRGLWAGTFSRPRQWREENKLDNNERSNNSLLNFIDVIFEKIGIWIDTTINRILDFIGR